ncbi:MAG: hypothetical protein BKP49_03245 [Treponema sp. CETP13]|nr:MAG: hypothetical protein BKP49_03245 [Treponema sp. CETP13]
MIKSIQHKFFSIVLLFITILFGSCVSAKDTVENAQVEVKYYTLDNGIPVIFEKNASNKVLSLNITVAGGTPLLEPEQAGLEDALFSMMTNGSEKYDYKTLSQLEYEKQFSLTSSAGRSGSTLSLNCIDYYFDDIFPVFVDGFLHPTFVEREFNSLMQGYSQSLQQKETDPSSVLLKSIQETLYKNHPYETTSEPTKNSLDSITVKEMKDWHAKILDSSRIFITVVGNYDSKKLVQKLNIAFGSIPSAKNSFVPSNIPELKIGGNPIIIENEIAAGSGYMACVLPAPNYDSKDLYANILAGNMYKDILFNIVREKNGACYSIGSGAMSGKAAYNMLYAIKVSDLENITTWINESEELLRSGMLIDSKDPKTGEYEYSTIEDRIEEYKNSYINSLFSVSETNQGLASLLIGNKLLYNNPERYLTVVNKIRNVTSADIKKCIDKYWTSDTKQWFVVTGAEDVNKVTIN